LFKNNDTCLVISMFFQIPEITNLLLVSKEFKKGFEAEMIWKLILKRPWGEYPNDQSKDGKVNYKNLSKLSKKKLSAKVMVERFYVFVNCCKSLTGFFKTWYMSNPELLNIIVNQKKGKLTASWEGETQRDGFEYVEIIWDDFYSNIDNKVFYEYGDDEEKIKGSLIKNKKHGLIEYFGYYNKNVLYSKLYKNGKEIKEPKPVPKKGDHFYIPKRGDMTTFYQFLHDMTK